MSSRGWTSENGSASARLGSPAALISVHGSLRASDAEERRVEVAAVRMLAQIVLEHREVEGFEQTLVDERCIVLGGLKHVGHGGCARGSVHNDHS